MNRYLRLPAGAGLPTFALALSIAASMSGGAEACGVRVDAVRGADPAIYQPFGTLALQTPLQIELSGPPGRSVHVRFELDPGRLQGGEILGRSGAGGLAVLSGPPGSQPPSAATIGQWWVPVSLDATGRGSTELTLAIGTGLTLTAGDWPLGLAVRVACSDGVGGFDEQPALLVASRVIRVATAVGAVGFDRSVIDLGPIPQDNPEGWTSGNGASLTVQATSPFQIRVDNPVLLLRHTGTASLGPTTTIPYNLEIDGVMLDGRLGGRRTVSCWRPNVVGALETQISVVPRLPANASAGRLAGQYRDELVVSVEPLELASPDPVGGPCR